MIPSFIPFQPLEVFISSPLLLQQKGSATDSPIHWQLLRPDRHLPNIHSWMQLPYAASYGPLCRLSFDELYRHYTMAAQSGSFSSLVGCFQDRPVCLADIYQPLHHVLGSCYDASETDAGLRFLMAPPVFQQIHRLSETMLSSLVRLLFSSPQIQRIVGDPASKNVRANLLLQKCGFRLLKKFQMEDKETHLYTYSRFSEGSMRPLPE